MRGKWQNGELNIEQVWCGCAIQYLYEYYGGEERLKMKNKEIIEKGKLRTDKNCIQVLTFILKHFYKLIAQVGIQYLTKNGIILVGNFAEIVASNINWTEVCSGYNEGISAILKQVPLYRLKTKNHGLIGCFSYVKKHSKSLQ